MARACAGPIRVLVTGGSGQLGQELARLGRLDWLTWQVVAAPRQELDVTAADQVEAALRRVAPDVVVHAAALTDVDRCEQDPEAARAVNVEGTRHVARACARRGVPLVYISTDYVFDGSKYAPYECTDVPNPLSVYGRTKLEGERVVQQAGCPYAIVRTAWLYSSVGRNFPKAILRAASQGGPLAVVVDQVGSPTYARDLARLLREMILRGLHRSGGIFHAVNAGACSRYEQARMLVELAGWPVTVEPVVTAAMPRPAPRPAYSALNPHSLCRHGIVPRTWKEALAEFAEDLRRQAPELFPPGRAATAER